MPYLIGAGMGVRLGDPDSDEAEECLGVGDPECEGVYVEDGDGYDGWCPGCADRRFADEDDDQDDEVSAGRTGRSTDEGWGLMSDFTIVYTDAGRTSPIWIERISGDTFGDALLAMIRDTDSAGSQQTCDAAAIQTFLASCHSVEVFDGHLPEARTAAEVLAGESS